MDKDCNKLIDKIVKLYPLLSRIDMDIETWEELKLLLLEIEIGVITICKVRNT